MTCNSLYETINSTCIVIMTFHSRNILIENVIDMNVGITDTFITVYGKLYDINNIKF